MGAAEVGRELGDAGGPLVVALAASAATLPVGMLTLAALLAVTATAVIRPAPQGAPAAPGGAPKADSRP